MSQFIDRRHNSRNKNAVNRRKFLQRFKKQILNSVATAVQKRSITDFEHGEQINIPTKDTYEPTIHHGDGGIRQIVLPGNRNLSRGDKIPRTKPESATNDSGASTDENGIDDFVFEISRDEFLDIFFDDLELPNMFKKQMSATQNEHYMRAGYTSAGVPTNINIIRSMRNALARRIAFGGNSKKHLQTAEEELNDLMATKSPDKQRIIELQATITKLRNKLNRIPFIDPFDLKYNRKVLQPMPAAKAVVFCLLDVSGSMDEIKKDLAKRFFILLYLFLTKTYDIIDIVFIRHHTSAKEVSEQDFFYSRETGGTVVSSALELMADILHDRYPINEWNIYGAQASDGDNWNNDSPRCREILIHRIMPFVQYFAYVEIMPRTHGSLWEEYVIVNAACANFAMQNISNTKDIYPVFRELFGVAQ